jgi:hypothetical protein
LEWGHINLLIRRLAESLVYRIKTVLQGGLNEY